MELDFEEIFSCISVGVVVLFLFYRNDFNSTNTTPSATKTTENIAENTVNAQKTNEE